MEEGCSQPVSDSVDKIEEIKKSLNIEVKRLLQYKSPCQPYQQCKSNILEILQALDVIPITVGDLRITKIGKTLTNYESKLPKELAKVCGNVNDKWKQVLRRYREEFKMKLKAQNKPPEFVGVESLPQPIKEPPAKEIVTTECYMGTTNHITTSLSCTSATRHVTATSSFQQRGVESPSNLNQTAPPSSSRSVEANVNTSQQSTFSAIVQQNLARSISKTFIQEVQHFFSQTMQQINHVETECLNIKVALANMQNKLISFERNMNSFVSTTAKPSNSSANNEIVTSNNIGICTMTNAENIANSQKSHNNQSTNDKIDEVDNSCAGNSTISSNLQSAIAKIQNNQHATTSTPESTCNHSTFNSIVSEKNNMSHSESTDPNTDCSKTEENDDEDNVSGHQSVVVKQNGSLDLTVSSVLDNIFADIAITPDEVRDNARRRSEKKSEMTRNDGNSPIDKWYIDFSSDKHKKCSSRNSVLQHNLTKGFVTYNRKVSITDTPSTFSNSLPVETKIRTDKENKLDIIIKQEELDSEAAEMFRSAQIILKRKHPSDEHSFPSDSTVTSASPCTTMAGADSRSGNELLSVHVLSNTKHNSNTKSLNGNMRYTEKKRMKNDFVTKEIEVPPTLTSQAFKTNTIDFCSSSLLKQTKNHHQNHGCTLFTEPQAQKGSTKNPFKSSDNVFAFYQKKQFGRVGGSCDEGITRKPNAVAVNQTDKDGFKVPQASESVTATPSSFIVRGEPVTSSGVDLNSVELEDFLSFSQAVDEMEHEIDPRDRDYLLSNKSRHRTSWNQHCKRKEGVKYAPLAKSNGRIKAVHKSSVGKEGVHAILIRRSKSQ